MDLSKNKDDAEQRYIELDTQFQKAAKEKFQKVNEAYETIKKERNIS